VNPKSLLLLGHVATGLMAGGFIVFFWMIYKKTRKVVKRSAKIKRREKNGRRY
jgi:hypothetical protein